MRERCKKDVFHPGALASLRAHPNHNNGGRNLVNSPKSKISRVRVLTVNWIPTISHPCSIRNTGNKSCRIATLVKLS